MYAGSQLIGIYVQGREERMYYVHTDRLGSYDVITDAVGNKDERLSFDAWGNRRNPDNWSEPEEGVTHLFSRGFTGHEHLDAFKIINMNGRLYDPVIGTFFSPDPFVADATGTQDFNRYAYARNNPLMYTDPSGEEPFTIACIAIGSVVFSYLGGVATNEGNFNPTQWDWKSGQTWGGMLIGGATGALGGWGFAAVGPALAGTFSYFGTSGIASAYCLTGMAMGGAAGYATGFGSGMLVSGGDWGFAAKLGLSYAAIGAAFGSIAGGIYGFSEDGQNRAKYGKPEIYKFAHKMATTNYTIPNGCVPYSLADINLGLGGDERKDVDYFMNFYRYNISEIDALRKTCTDFNLKPLGEIQPFLKNIPMDRPGILAATEDYPDPITGIRGGHAMPLYKVKIWSENTYTLYFYDHGKVLKLNQDSKIIFRYWSLKLK